MQPAPHIVYTPVPDSPFSPLDMNPPMLDATMRSDSPDPGSPRRASPRRRRGNPPRRWGDVPIEEAAPEERRIFRGKWGRQCKRQTCKKTPRPPPPPPPAAAIAVHGGTRRRANGSRKCRGKTHRKTHRKTHHKTHRKTRC